MFGLYISVVVNCPSLDAILCLRIFTINGSSYPGLNPTLPLSELNPRLLGKCSFFGDVCILPLSGFDLACQILHL